VYSMIDLIRRIVFWWSYPRHLPHPASREFLDTYEWAQVLYQVLLKYRAKPCMACGRGPKQGVWLNVDHIKPRKTHPHLARGFVCDRASANILHRAAARRISDTVSRLGGT
jgi:hypothetical protein